MAECADINKEPVKIVIKWCGKEYSIENLHSSSTVLQLKEVIFKETGVLAERQKLLGLKYKGKVPGDDVRISQLALKPGAKIMMMGTREENLVNVLQSSPETDGSEVINDFDIEEEEILIENRDVYLAKITRRVSEYKFEVINEPRPNKKLLVLDVDYTLFDHRSVAETGMELMRPYLHEFLTSCYKDYDIIIWSATNMKWVKAKMEELSVLGNPEYKITLMLDSLAMITVDHPKYGVIETKPLGVIWGKFPEHYNKENSIIIDDLRRNFIMNPNNGLKIRPFRQAHQNRETDKELKKLSKYLKQIATQDTFVGLDHDKWEQYLKKCKLERKGDDTET